MWKQYLTYITDLAQGNLGYSINFFPASVGEMILVSLPWTIATSSSVQPGQGAGFLGHGNDPLRLEQLVPEVLDFTPDGLSLPAGVSPERSCLRRLMTVPPSSRRQLSV